MGARQIELLKSFDISDVQGALLALSEISLAYRQKVDDAELKERLLREVSLQPTFHSIKLIWMTRHSPIYHA